MASLSAADYSKIDFLLNKSSNVKQFCKLYEISNTCKDISTYFGNEAAEQYITYKLNVPEKESSSKRKRNSSIVDTVDITNSSKKSKRPNVKPIEFDTSINGAKSTISGAKSTISGAKSAISGAKSTISGAKSAISNSDGSANTIIISRKSYDTSNIRKKTHIPPSPSQLKKKSVKHCSCCGIPHLKITTCGKNANHPCSKCNGGPSDDTNDSFIVNNTPQIRYFTHVTPTSDYVSERPRRGSIIKTAAKIKTCIDLENIDCSNIKSDDDNDEFNSYKSYEEEEE